eukprot:38838-Prorocentrum_lima.AAC.1
MIHDELDCRDRWLGLRQLKTAYSPSPYSRTTATGTHVSPSQVPHQAALYLAHEHWGTQQAPYPHPLPLTAMEWPHREA